MTFLLHSSTQEQTMRIRKRFSVLILAVALAGMTPLGCAGANDTAGQESPRRTSGQQVKTPVKTQVKTMKTRLKLENAAITATLDDNATSRDFASLLPLTLTLTDYAETEKISDLPKRLSTEGAPAGSDPAVGDITYYAPWGNLAIFHKDFGYSSGLVKLGRIDSGVEALKRPGPLKVTIERVEK
jgi:hypothetical protein